MMPDDLPEWSPKLAAAAGDVLSLLRVCTRVMPKTFDDLQDQFDLRWEELWAVIEQLWRDGEPIGTDGERLWYANDETELASTLEYLREQEELLNRECEAMEQARDRLDKRSRSNGGLNG